MHDEVDGENGNGGSVVAGLTIPAPACWDEDCPPYPDLPVSLSSLVNAVDVQFEYNNDSIPRRFEPTQTPLAITIRVNPDTVKLAACDPPRGSDIGAGKPDGGRAVVVKVSDPNLSTNMGAEWWGCYLWTDEREHEFQWDGKLYKHVQQTPVPEEWCYTKSSDLFMSADVQVKDRILEGEATLFECPVYIEQVKTIERYPYNPGDLPKTSFSFLGPEEHVICVEGGSTDVPLQGLDQPKMQGDQRIPHPHNYGYSFWVAEGNDKIKVYEKYGTEDPVPLDDQTTTGIRWYSPRPEGEPGLPGKLIIESKGVVSTTCDDVKLRFQAHRVDEAGEIQQSFPETMVPMTVVKIEEVEWLEVDSPLDTNPNAGGGKRMFPGKQSPDDEVDRRVVKIRAGITPVLKDVDVYFKVFDVDDPSADGPPIDDETLSADNRGAPTPPPPSAKTNEDGEATVDFGVSMQPGDNFRAVASAMAPEEWLNNLSPIHPDGTDAWVKDGQGNRIPDDGRVSELLTVWRRLHVEADSMGVPWETGTSTDVVDNRLTDSTKDWTPDRFVNFWIEEWMLDPNTSGVWWGILANDATVVYADGSIVPHAEAGDPYRIEQTYWEPDDALRSDDIPQPDVSAFANAFRRCYVEIEDVGFTDTATEWQYNFCGHLDYMADYGAKFRGTNDQESADFWVVYVVQTYEGYTFDDDNDPNSEYGCKGCCIPQEPEYTLVFEEVLRDVASQHGWTEAEKEHVNQGTALHEVGHQFELQHSPAPGPTDVMWVTGNDAEEDLYKTRPSHFRDEDINVIRWTISP